MEVGHGDPQLTLGGSVGAISDGPQCLTADGKEQNTDSDKQGGKAVNHSILESNGHGVIGGGGER